MPGTAITESSQSQSATIVTVTSKWDMEVTFSCALSLPRDRRSPRAFQPASYEFRNNDDNINLVKYGICIFGVSTASAPPGRRRICRSKALDYHITHSSIVKELGLLSRSSETDCSESLALTWCFQQTSAKNSGLFRGF